MGSYIFIGLVGLIRLTIAIVLFQVGEKKNMPNLKWLAWGFAASVVAIPVSSIYYIPYVDKALAYVRFLCYAIFIHQTFYRGRRSPLVPFWSVFSLLFLFLLWTTASSLFQATGISFPQNLFFAQTRATSELGGAAVSMAELAGSFLDGLLQLIIWLWHAIAAFQAYRVIARDRYVDDWIKSRYKLMMAYSCLQAFVGIPMMATPMLSASAASLMALLTILTTIMQYLVWAMPDWYSKWLNRNFQLPAEAQEAI